MMRVDELIRRGGALLKPEAYPGQIDQHDVWYTEARAFLAVNAPTLEKKLGAVAPKYGDQLLDSRNYRAYYNVIQEQVEVLREAKSVISEQTNRSSAMFVPVEIQDSLLKFGRDHPDSSACGFIMMSFGDTPAHRRIAKVIKTTLESLGKSGVRADDRRYHHDLHWNVVTYMHGCAFGIAVFERLASEFFNPNVAFEVGYMYALAKPVCLLRDKTLSVLQADLIGKIHDSFDPQRPKASIPQVLGDWIQTVGSGPDSGLKL